MRNNKHIRDSIAKDRFRKNSASRAKLITKHGSNHFHDIKRLEEDRVSFTTDYMGNPIIVKKPKPYLFGGGNLAGNKKGLYKLEKQQMTAELAKNILKDKFSTTSTREALRQYLGDTRGTLTTQRTVSSGLPSARPKSPRIESKIIKELQGSVKRESTRVREEGVEESILRKFEERKERLREEAKVRGSIIAVRQFMMKLNPSKLLINLIHHRRGGNNGLWKCYFFSY